MTEILALFFLFLGLGLLIYVLFQKHLSRENFVRVETFSISNFFGAAADPKKVEEKLDADTTTPSPPTEPTATPPPTEPTATTTTPPPTEPTAATTTPPPTESTTVTSTPPTETKTDVKPPDATITPPPVTETPVAAETPKETELAATAPPTSAPPAVTSASTTTPTAPATPKPFDTRTYSDAKISTIKQLPTYPSASQVMPLYLLALLNEKGIAPPSSAAKQPSPSVVESTSARKIVT